ncbi:MAG TPA: acetoacetate decarboxylase family protein [Dehalococcoidia bacterium]|nr:acetoacetate decarboxylase family protein [Dehalococcoidia bacterium]
MNEPTDTPEIPFPPPPWRLSGELWAGLFQTDRPVPVPPELRHLIGPRWLVIVLARYLGGTLHYDELAFGVFARRGVRVGLYVDHLWVNNPASLWGGRRIWGLPKERAEFDWSGSTVRVGDSVGTIASLRLESRVTGHVPMWLPAAGFGQLDGRWAITLMGLRARLRPARWDLGEWSDRFPYRAVGAPVLGLAGAPMRLLIPAPVRST